MSVFNTIRQQISNHPSNAAMQAKGYQPLYTAAAGAKIVIIGQAPGIKAQTSMIPWDDASGVKLREWLGVTDEQFYDENLISLLPMDFYYPGKGKTGDLPPRKDFAPMWHQQLLDLMPNVQLILLVGKYAQDYYLGDNKAKNLTETVRSYTDYLPRYFPIVHPSPLNFRWQAKNPWFIDDIVPDLQKRVQDIVSKQ